MMSPTTEAYWSSKVTPELRKKVATLPTAPYCRESPVKVGDLVRWGGYVTDDGTTTHGIVTGIRDDKIYVFWFCSASDTTYGVYSYGRSSIVLLQPLYLTADEVAKEYDIS